MKNIFLLLFLLLSTICFSKGIYVNPVFGNDGNTGLSSAQAWKTINKINNSWSTIISGDSIYLAGGLSIYGCISIGKPNITITSYGAGRAKIIGYTEINTWSSIGSGVYQASVVSSNSLNLVTVNGYPKRLGRFPNASATWGGYRPYTTGTTSYIIDPTLTGTEDWVGKQIVIKVAPFKVDRFIITSIIGSTINFRPYYALGNGVTTLLTAPQTGNGYFIEDGNTFLDEDFEWWKDSTTNTLLMYFGTNTPSNYVVRVGTKDTGINGNNKSGLVVSRIDFEGQNICGVYSFNAPTSIKVQGSSMLNMGVSGIIIANTPVTYLDSISIRNTLSNGIAVNNRNTNITTITNIDINNIAPYVGVGSWFSGGDYNGVFMNTALNSTLRNFNIDTVAFNGVSFQGTNLLIRDGYINYVCYLLDDGGGVYTYFRQPGRYFNRKVKNVTVENGIGCNDGLPNPANRTKDVALFYIDGLSMNVIFDSCYGKKSASVGAQIGNLDSNTITNCILYDCPTSFDIIQPIDNVHKFITLQGNTSYLTNSSQFHMRYVNIAMVGSLSNNLASLGNINNNFYNSKNAVGFKFLVKVGASFIPISNYSLHGWQILGGQDAGSSSIHDYSSFLVKSTIGANKLTNPNFSTSLGWSFAGSSSSFVYGGGHGLISFTSPIPNTYSNINQAIGALDISKNYIFTITTTGTNANGIIAPFLRKQTSPNTILSPIQYQSFDETKQEHKFLFAHPISMAASSIFVQVEQGSGNTQLDTLSLYECSVEQYNTSDSIKIYTNPTSEIQNIVLPYRYSNIYGTLYTTIPISAYSTVLLFFYSGFPPTHNTFIITNKKVATRYGASN